MSRQPTFPEIGETAPPKWDEIFKRPDEYVGKEVERRVDSKKVKGHLDRINLSGHEGWMVVDKDPPTSKQKAQEAKRIEDEEDESQERYDRNSY